MGPSRGGPGHWRSYSSLRTVVLPVVNLDDRIGHLSRGFVLQGAREPVVMRIVGTAGECVGSAARVGGLGSFAGGGPSVGTGGCDARGLETRGGRAAARPRAFVV